MRKVTSRPLVRSLHRGSGNLRLTIYYSADPEGLPEARLTGIVRPAAGPLCPIVVFLGGINVVPGSYRWLAVRLAQVGYVVAVTSLIDDLGPVGQGISPGLDMSMLAPSTLGTGPSASAVSETLRLVQQDPVVGSVVAEDRVAFGGHSAGGTVALHNARADWFEPVKACFSYAGHTMIAGGMGHDRDSFLPLPESTPVLLLAGAQDGVISESRDRYGGDKSHDPVRATFETLAESSRSHCWWVEIADGTHFSMCDPIDHTSGRSFLDPPKPVRQGETRELIARLVLSFLGEHVPTNSADRPTTDLREVVTDAGVSAWARR